MYPYDNITLFFARHIKKLKQKKIFCFTFLSLYNLLVNYLNKNKVVWKNKISDIYIYIYIYISSLTIDCRIVERF